MEKLKEPKVGMTIRKNSIPVIEELEAKIAEFIAEALYEYMIKRNQTSSNIDKENQAVF